MTKSAPHFLSGRNAIGSPLTFFSQQGLLPLLCRYVWPTLQQHRQFLLLLQWWLVGIITANTQWRWEGGHLPRAALCRGGIWRGKNMEFWNLAASGELALALQDGFIGFLVQLHYVITPQYSVLSKVHTNAIVVTIRISTGDLIAGLRAATKRV